MNRYYRSLLLAFLAGAIGLPAGLCWAQTKGQTQNPPPQKKVVEQKKEDPPEDYTEEEYNAFEQATAEPDLAKRATLLVAFMDKYPKSKLQPNITASYEGLLYKVWEAGDFKKLEPLAEQWLKFNPNDLKTQAYIFDSAVKLGEHQKVVDWGEKIYVQKPSAELASNIYDSYTKLGNKAKKTEWALKLMELPENNANFDLPMQFVVEYAANDLPKAAEYAQRALTALARAQKPATASDADWNKAVTIVQKNCHDILGMNFYNQSKWAQAVPEFEKAIKVERYDAGFYYIGMSQWRLEDVDNAIMSFAKAEALAGKLKGQATTHLEELYKSQHNGSLVGIDKVRRKAKAELGVGTSNSDGSR
jgi:tetratricopeptide (TPR) repeat protein